MNVFDRIVRFLDRGEVSFVMLVSKLIPLIVPIIPAYVGFSHVTDKVSGLGFDSWAGWVYGAVIEGLGYAAIYKAVQFMEHNKRYTAEKNQAPLTMAIVIYAVYLIVTLTVNVVLDYKAGLVLYKVVALGLISLLSVPAGLLMSISAIHTERTTERERANVEAKNRRSERPNEQRTNARTNSERTHRITRRSPMPTNEQTNDDQDFGFPTGDKQARLFEYIEQLEANGEPIPGPSELGRRLEMSKSYISERLSERRSS